MSNQSNVLVNDHAAFKQSLYRPAEIESMWGDFNEVDHLAASAPPNPRASCDVDRVLSILDKLQVEELCALNLKEKGAK